jgi:hypothetical protein
MRFEKNPSNKIATLWFGGALRNIDHVCLSSMVKCGMDVTLYHYKPVRNVPDGVKISNGRDILDPSLIDRLSLIRYSDHNNWRPIVNFSDFFRIQLQKYGKGLWLDTDVLLFREFRFDLNREYYALEGHGRIGSPVFYLPQHHPIILEYQRLLESPTLMPNWLGIRRGVLRPMWWRVTGQKYSAPDLGITIYGNDAFTRLAKRHKCYNKAELKESFYHWTGRDTDKIFTCKKFHFLLQHPEHLGIHVHRKDWEYKPILRDTIWGWAVKHYAPHKTDAFRWAD